MNSELSPPWAGETMPRFEPLEPRLLLDAGDIVINEIMYHPGFGDIGQSGYVPENLSEEYVELFNRGADPINLNGWQFTQGVSFTFPDVTIPGQGYLIVAADADAFHAKYPAVDMGLVVAGWTGRLGNAGQDLELENDLGQRIDFVPYADEGDWAVREKAIPKTVASLTSSGTTATGTVLAHGFYSGDYIRIAGAGQTQYNGVFRIANATTDTFTYTLSSTTTSPATGAITAQKTDLGYVGWEWSGATDGGGKSLELINPAITNECGQNWAASLPDNGTPGAANSVAAADIAPMIVDVTHLPAIPRSTDPVTVTARLIDELAATSVTLYWRVDANPQTSPFTATPMVDDGQHGDGYAGDGLYGAVLPAQADRTIVEFYLEAQDAGAHTRTWPAPVPGYGQAANLLYQVDNTYDPDAAWVPGSAPIYRMIMTESEWGYLSALMSASAPGADSNAQMNGTLVTIDGTGLDVIYQAGIRNRGNGSRYGTPHNYHINIPHDRQWNGVTAINVNARNTYAQAIGSAIFHLAGIGGPNETPVQVRVNGLNYAMPGSGMYGLYAAKETFDSDLVEHWFPEDASGNLYLCFYDDSISPRDVADLRYEGATPDAYRNCYFKKTNAAFDDWSDLINMTYLFANEPDATFLETISTVVNVDQWLRYIATDSLLGNNEGGLCTGVGDDYALYRGVNDPRFVLMAHDLDTVEGISSGSATRGIFTGYTGIPALNRLLSNPELVRRYYGQFLDLMNTVFAPANFNVLVDQLFTGWLPQATIDGIKSFNLSRITSVLGQIPQDLTATSALAQQSGYYRTTSATTSLSGLSHAATTQSVLVNGAAATWTPRGATWSAGNVALQPGINRVTVQAYDGPNGTGNLIDTATIDIWYDDGTTDDYPKTDGDPPPPPPAPVLTADLLVRDSYLPGIPVLVRVEALKDGQVNRDLWDATAGLAVVDNAGITLSTDSCSLYNGLGSTLLTITGSGNFTLTATVNGLTDTVWLTDLTGQPMTSVSGTLAGASLNWSGIVHVTGDVLVPDGSTLTLQPGTLVLLDGVASGTAGTDIDVQGAVQSLGTAASPISFTAYDPATAWGEIHHSGAEASVYQYTDFTRAGRSPGQGHTGTGPAFNVSNSTITFDHVAITDNVGKIMQASSGTDLEFHDCILARSTMGPEITGTALLLENSWISDMRSPNDSDGFYIHDQLPGQTVLMTGGVLAGVDDDGLDTYRSVVTMENYIVRDTKDKGVSAYGGTVNINGSLLVDCGLAPEDGPPTSIQAKEVNGYTCVVNIDHTTVVGRDVGIYAYNKFGSGGLTAINEFYVTNSIILASLDPVMSDYVPSGETYDPRIHISYSTANTAVTYPGTGNLNQDPLFVDPTNYDYHLQAASPCVNTGDPAAAADPDLTVTDQGCFWYDHGTPVLPEGSLTEDTVWSAAGGPYRVTGQLTVPFGITLTILPGTSVYFEPNAQMIIGGRLIAEGTPYQSIRFTRTPGTAGAWLGLQFTDTVRDNRLTYAVLEYGVTDSGLVGLVNSNLVIDHCTFDHSDRRRIRTIDSSLIVRNSIFTDIFPGTQAPTTNNRSEHIWGGGYPDGGIFLIENNLFGTTKGHNDAIDIDGGTRPGTIPQILNNVFMGGGDDALDLETDAHIEGNVFLHFRRDAYNTDPGESNVISAGGGKDYTVVRNVFYDCDHAALIKDGAFMTFVNNTVEGAAISALYFEVPGDSLAPGRGAYVDGSIFWNTALVFDQIHVDTQLTVNRSIVTADHLGRGVGNLAADPRLAGVPAAAAAGPGGDFRLGLGSPAAGTGPNGRDMGAMVPAGASIAGEPPAMTWLTSATLTVGGPDIYAYKYRVNDGPWSGEIAQVPPGLPAVPVALTGLADGTYHVDVVTKNSAGVWQTPGQATASHTWTVDTAMAPHVQINEVLADNRATDSHGGLWPDLVELYNDGQGTIDLSGMSLTDNPLEMRKFVFAPGTTLAQGQYLVLYGGSDPATPENHLGFSLKADGDDLYLFDTDAQSAGQLDAVAFGIQLADYSIGRRADGTWGLAEPTFGTANVAARTGDPATLKLNEWLADEQVLFGDDFVELYNPDPLPVPLGGLYLTDTPWALARMQTLHDANPALAAPRAIPALSFVAGGGLAVFRADGDPEKGADHADFKISSQQDLLGLLNADFAPLDTLMHYTQTTDVSQGRNGSGAAAFTFYTLPHPGVTNPGVTVTVTVSETVTPIFGFSQDWRYNQTANLDGQPWKAYDYAAESSWPHGPGLLFVENNVPQSLRGTPLALGRLTYYFRTHFTYDADPTSNTVLQFYLYVDDGAVIYLNGYELSPRFHMGGGTVTYSTLASSHEFSLEGPFEVAVSSLPAGTLKHGDNVIAVEVHQVNSSSTDIVWGMSLNIKETVVTTSTTIVNPIPDAIVALAGSGLRITEVMFNPLGGSDYEYIELKNTSATTAVDLAGVRLGGGVDFTFPAMTLAPNAYVLVVADQAKFESRYGTGLHDLIAGQFSGKLSDDGETVALQLPVPYEAAIQRFDYSGSWYPQTQSGYSLVMIDPTLPRTAWFKRTSWEPSTVVGGSPGAAEPAGPGAVIINEVLAHQDTDIPGDWVELTNTTGSPVDLSGWFLSDDGADLQKYQIPAGTVLPAHGYLVFTEYYHFGQAGSPGALKPFALSEYGEEVHLSTTGYHEMAVFDASPRDVTFGPHVTLVGGLPVSEFVALGAPTPGEENAYPLVGPVVINELMYHPAAAGDWEYIELRNLSNADVPMYDPNHPANTWRFTEGPVDNGTPYALPEGAYVPAGGYALIVQTTPDLFRAHYPSVPASVNVYGPYPGALSNGGEPVELRRPGDPDPVTGEVPYYRVDRVVYDDDPPWPTGTADPLIERVLASRYGNDPANWAAGPTQGTPGLENTAAPPPKVVEVELNDRPVRGAGAIDPSGRGVRTLDIRFSEPVAFLPSDVVVQVVTFPGGTEQVEATLTPAAVTGSGSDTMRITLPAGAARDTWVKVTLSGAAALADLTGRLLDGEPSATGNGRAYILDASDLPTGNGTAGGDAVFYVGSLRGDFTGDRQVTADDIGLFAAAFAALNLDADFRGRGFGIRPPDGLITLGDVDGFASVYQAAVAVNRRLDTLPAPLGGVPLAAVTSPLREQGVAGGRVTPDASAAAPTLCALTSPRCQAGVPLSGPAAPSGHATVLGMDVLALAGGWVTPDASAAGVPRPACPAVRDTSVLSDAEDDAGDADPLSRKQAPALPVGDGSPMAVMRL